MGALSHAVAGSKIGECLKGGLYVSKGLLVYCGLGFEGVEVYRLVYRSILLLA